MSTERVFLCPRPYAQLSGQLLLLPLLPHRKPLKFLPSEIWTVIFAYVLQFDGDTACASPLLKVCKAFKVREFASLLAEFFTVEKPVNRKLVCH